MKLKKKTHKSAHIRIRFLLYIICVQNVLIFEINLNVPVMSGLLLAFMRAEFCSIFGIKW